MQLTLQSTVSVKGRGFRQCNGTTDVMMATVLVCCVSLHCALRSWRSTYTMCLLPLTLQDAHDASLVALHFFAGEPLLMSAGADNSIKHWVGGGGSRWGKVDNICGCVGWA